MDVCFENVCFSYPSRPDVQVLAGVSFTVPTNSTAAFVGSSGSGKSTVLALLERFYDVSDGSILQENKTKQMIENCKDMLGNEGRIFARMSGTESLLRVMIECKNSSILDKVIQEVDSFFIKL
jgi:ABC-type oligopeptide transport system ATPase subunit